MSDYLINYTDPSKDAFVVKPWTANGPLSPATASPLLPGAITADTSLAIVGKGRFEYGENVQENLVRMLEHFAFATAPYYPIEGQLWYKNTTGELFLYDSATWNAAVISGKNTTPVDFNGVVLQNVGNAVLPTDALNSATADTMYLQLAGGTMVGALILDADPVLTLEAATKGYVDTQIPLVISASYLPLVGGTITGHLVIQGSGSPSAGLTIAGGTLELTSGCTFDAGGAVLSNITDDPTPSTAVTRGYVDALPIGVGVPTTMIYNGVADSISVTRVGDTPVVSNNIIQNTVTDTNPNFDSSFVREQLYPTDTNILQYIEQLDKAAGAATRRVKRFVETGVTGTTVTLPFKYNVETDRLMIHKNYLKLNRHERAISVVDFQPTVHSGSPLAILPDIYGFDITVDGTPYTDVLVNLNPYPQVYGKLLAQIFNLELATRGYQTVSFAVPLVDGSELTGYTPALIYSADITVDGLLSVVTADSNLVTTIAELVAEIDSQLANATAFVYSGKLYVQATSRGLHSTILIDDSSYGDKMFSDLTGTPAIDTAVDGANIGDSHGFDKALFSVSLSADGSDPTPYGATPYDATITVDGIIYNIAVPDGTTLGTVQDLIDLLNTEFAGAAVVDIVPDLAPPFDNQLRIKSLTTGSNSYVTMTDSGIGTGLFTELTNFTGFLGTQYGTPGVRVIFEEGQLLMMSPTVGSSSSMVVAAPSNVTDLWSNFISVTPSITNSTISNDYDYAEVGSSLLQSETIELTAPRIAPDVIEYVLLPGWFVD